MSSFSFRRDIITKPIFSWAHGVLPAMSDTEREALEAGDVWWDADLFTGNPDWSKLLANAPATLTPEEKAFLNGPVDELCAMLDDWKINWEWRDLPPRSLGFHQARQILRHDHSEGIWRARLLALCAFRSGAENFDPLGDRRRHRDGAELARPRRIADALRHQGAAAAMAAAPCRWPRDSLFRADQPGSRLRRRLDDRQRHHLQGHFRGQGSARPAAELAQALHHARPGRDAARPRLQGLRSRSSGRLAGRTRHHRGADPDPSARRRDRPSPSAVDAGVSERPQQGPRCLHPDGLHHRRPGTPRPGLEDADDGARRRPRHLAAVAVGGGRRLCRAHHRRLCAHPRAVQRADRKIRGHRGAAGAHRRHRLSARRRAAADLCGAQPGPSSRCHFRHHEAACHRADADRDRRRHGHPWRQGRDRRPAELSSAISIARCRSASPSRAPIS